MLKINKTQNYDKLALLKVNNVHLCKTTQLDARNSQNLFRVRILHHNPLPCGNKENDRQNFNLLKGLLKISFMKFLFKPK